MILVNDVASRPAGRATGRAARIAMASTGRRSRQRAEVMCASVHSLSDQQPRDVHFRLASSDDLDVPAADWPTGAAFAEGGKQIGVSSDLRLRARRGAVG